MISPASGVCVKNGLSATVCRASACYGQDASSVAKIMRVLMTYPRLTNDRFSVGHSCFGRHRASEGVKRRQEAAEAYRFHQCTNDKKFHFFRQSPLQRASFRHSIALNHRFSPCAVKYGKRADHAAPCAPCEWSSRDRAPVGQTSDLYQGERADDARKPERRTVRAVGLCVDPVQHLGEVRSQRAERTIPAPLPFQYGNRSPLAPPRLAGNAP